MSMKVKHGKATEMHFSAEQKSDYVVDIACQRIKLSNESPVIHS